MLRILTAVVTLAATLWMAATPSTARAEIDNPAVPASTTPPAEASTAQVGTAWAYARADHVHPRSSRASTFVTAAGGVLTGTWNTALGSANPQLVFTPISPAGTAVKCQLTAAPTATTFQAWCATEQSTLLNLSILGSGLTLAPSAASAAGISVQVVAITPTQ